MIAKTTHRLLVIAASFLLVAVVPAISQMNEVFRLARGASYKYDYWESNYRWSFSWSTSTLDSGVVEYVVKDSSIVSDSIVTWLVLQKREVIRQVRRIGQPDSAYRVVDSMLFALDEVRSGLHELRRGVGVWEFTTTSPPAYRVFRYADSTWIRIAWRGSDPCHVIPGTHDSLTFSTDSSLTRRSYCRCDEHDDWGSILRRRARLLSYRVLSVNDVRFLPDEIRLFQNYPNPFNPTTRIEYAIPKTSHVSLKVFDLLGREVATLVDEVQSLGFKSVEFDASGLASGVYYYQLRMEESVQSRKLIIMR